MRKLKLLAVFPHPDDESLGLGGTLARYSAEGVETYLICATRGQRGWPKENEPNPGPDVLGQIRESELRGAAGVLGLHEVTLLDYMDGDVDQANPQEIISELVKHIRRIRPDVVVTFPPDGNYGHPDHIALAQFTAAALVCAADASYSDSVGQTPHRVAKFYHMADSKEMVAAVHETIGPITMEVDGIERGQFGWDEWAISAVIDTRQFFDTLWKAVLCHQSQLPGLGSILEQPREALLRFWGRGTFIRVYSMVNGGRKVETDLFEGLR